MLKETVDGEFITTDDVADAVLFFARRSQQCTDRAVDGGKPRVVHAVAQSIYPRPPRRARWDCGAARRSNMRTPRSTHVHRSSNLDPSGSALGSRDRRRRLALGRNLYPAQPESSPTCRE